MATENAVSDKWYFTKQQLDTTPSRKCGYDALKELSYRQQTANFIQDMGQKLKVSQLCINTAIVYMHRFYVFHSFTNFPWHQMAAAALFLAAKVEEQPRKLEYIIRVANMCRNSRDTNIDITSERYIAQSQDLVFNENVLLQTLGFDVAIDHPHTHVVRCCHLVRASKDLAQSSYFLASNSLHLTTMCLQYKPTVVACFCIHLACKWSSWEIPLSTEQKEWFLYVDPTVTAELLHQLTNEFLTIFESCPSRLKEKIMSIGDNGTHNTTNTIVNSPFDTDPKKVTPPSAPSAGGEQKEGAGHPHRGHEAKPGKGPDDPHKHRRPHDSSSSTTSSSAAAGSQQQQQQQQREREYREKKEREKLATQQNPNHHHHHHSKTAVPPGGAKHSAPPHGHHRTSSSGDPNKMKVPHPRGGAPPPSGGAAPPPLMPPAANRVAEPRDILREAARDSPFGIAIAKIPSNSNTSVGASASAHYLHQSSGYNNNGEKRRSDPKIGKHHDHPSNKVRHDSGNKLNENPSVNNSISGGDLNNKKNTANSSSITVNNNNNVNNKLVSTSSSSSSYSSSTSSAIPSSHHYHHHGHGSSSQKAGGPQPPPPPAATQSSQSVPKVAAVYSNGEAPPPAAKQEGDIVNSAIKRESDSPLVGKRPSLFSPSPPKAATKTALPSSPPLSASLADFLPSLSPIKDSPAERRTRNYSTGSEPELRPVLKKIDHVVGFESLMNDPTIGINRLHQVPDIITPISDKEVKLEPGCYYSKELKPPDIIPPLYPDNVYNANPILISSLLKEAAATPTVSHLVVNKTSENSTIYNSNTTAVPVPEKDLSGHHHKSKKKNKDKHKHKSKEREKSRGGGGDNDNGKEKKKKHKDKDKEKHKHRDKPDKAKDSSSSSTTTTTTTSTSVPEPPIKIKIQKDKIQAPTTTNNSSPTKSLKLRIPKDAIKPQDPTETSSQQPPLNTNSLKIKIPKEVIDNCAPPVLTNDSSSSSRKRERDRGGAPSAGAPPPKSARREAKQNGRHNSYAGNKVSISKVPPLMGSSIDPPVLAPPPPPPYQMQQQQQQQQQMYYYHQAHHQAPPQYMYPPPDMSYFYNQGYMYSPVAGMYHHQMPPPQQQQPVQGSGGAMPPLPADAPPDIPPPPPPE